MKSTRRALGHSLLRSLVRSHRSLIRLLRTALSASALRCAYSLARSLTHYGAHGKETYVYEMNASFLYVFGPQCAVGARFERRIYKRYILERGRRLSEPDPH